MNFRIENFREHLDREYDVTIGALGFETRSSFIPSRLSARSKHKFAIFFEENQELSFEENRKKLLEKNFQLVPASGLGGFQSRLAALIQDLPDNSAYIAVDISSMTRYLMAQLVQMLYSLLGSAILQVDFLYTPAKFVSPKTEAGPISIFQPVTREFAGWSTNPELPLAAVIGLGNEYERALGVIEYLEASPVYAFEPIGLDQRYDQALKEANSGLVEIIPKENFLPFRIDDPFDVFLRMESLIYGLKAKHRVVIIPLGPKIFSIVAFLVSLVHAGDVSVWRVSEDTAVVPIDRITSEVIIGISMLSQTHGVANEPNYSTTPHN